MFPISVPDDSLLIRGSLADRVNTPVDAIRRGAVRCKQMVTERTSVQAIELFEPDAQAVYSIEAAAHLAQVPRHTILVYCKHGLVAPMGDPSSGGYYFSAETIRALRRIESLRATCGNDFAGMRIILELLNEVRQLRAELRSLRPETRRRTRERIGAGASRSRAQSRSVASGLY